MPAPVDEVMDVPAIPAIVAQPLAFGFRSLLADFTFLEAIQVFPTRKSDMTAAATAGIDRRLQRLLAYSVDVDPGFAGAYRLIGAALPHDTVDGKAMGVLPAIQLLEQGLRARPDDWHIGFLLGFLQSYYLEDYAAAGASFAEAARREGAPAYLGLLATRVAAQGGELRTAITLAEAMLAQATEDESRRQWQDRLDALLMERDLRAIEAAAAQYKAAKGAFPRSVRELRVAGFLPSEPREPHGGLYLIDAGGQARSTLAERLRVFGAGARLEVH
jgi:hypothetical protein